MVCVPEASEPVTVLPLFVIVSDRFSIDFKLLHVFLRFGEDRRCFGLRCWGFGADGSPAMDDELCGRGVVVQVSVFGNGFDWRFSVGGRFGRGRGRFRGSGFRCRCRLRIKGIDGDGAGSGGPVGLGFVEEANEAVEAAVDLGLVAIQQAESVGVVGKDLGGDGGFDVGAGFGDARAGALALGMDLERDHEHFVFDDAAFAPEGIGNVVDEVEFEEALGLVVVDEFEAARVVVGAALAGDADEFGSDAVFEGVVAAGILAGLGFGASGFLVRCAGSPAAAGR